MRTGGDGVSGNGELTPSQKIRKLRKAGGFTQDDLAAVLKCTKSRISKIEKGDLEYSKEDIVALKKFLGVADAPLTDAELVDFKKRLYKWRDLIKNNLTEEARKTLECLSVITRLPFEPDLKAMYKMFEIRFMIKERDIKTAEKSLSAYECDVDRMTPENQYHFYHNAGSLYVYKQDFKSALRFYHKAQDLDMYVLEKDSSLHLNIAICYSNLGKCTLAISVLERVHYHFDYNIASVLRLYLDNVLALNYLRIGQINKAKQLFDRTLMEAKSFGDKIKTGHALHNYGCACWKAGEFSEAIDNFDKAFECFGKGDEDYLENLYWKIRCLIADKKPSKARVLLVEAKSLATNDEHYAMAFEALSHLLSISDDKSIEFIETKVIKYFIEKHLYFIAIDYCQILEDIFARRGKGYKIRALEIAATVRQIMEEMAFSEE